MLQIIATPDGPDGTTCWTHYIKVWPQRFWLVQGVHVLRISPISLTVVAEQCCWQAVTKTAMTSLDCLLLMCCLGQAMGHCRDPMPSVRRHNKEDGLAFIICHAIGSEDCACACQYVSGGHMRISALRHVPVRDMFVDTCAKLNWPCLRLKSVKSVS